jgi:Cu+-exporting ATPase
MSDGHQSGHDHPHDGGALTAEATEGSVWTCPMHPQVRRSGPGSCPICGMALEPAAPSLEESSSPELGDMTTMASLVALRHIRGVDLEIGAGQIVEQHLEADTSKLTLNRSRQRVTRWANRSALCFSKKSWQA